MAVPIRIVEMVVAVALLQAGFEPQAGRALRLGLWILGRSLRRTD